MEAAQRGAPRPLHAMQCAGKATHKPGNSCAPQQILITSQHDAPATGRPHEAETGRRTRTRAATDGDAAQAQDSCVYSSALGNTRACTRETTQPSGTARTRKRNAAQRVHSSHTEVPTAAESREQGPPEGQAPFYKSSLVLPYQQCLLRPSVSESCAADFSHVRTVRHG
jgi:hypothetical protein